MASSLNIVAFNLSLSTWVPIFNGESSQI